MCIRYTIGVTAGKLGQVLEMLSQSVKYGGNSLTSEGVCQQTGARQEEENLVEVVLLDQIAVMAL